MASKSPDPYQELEETLACPLCLERCRDPRSLTCLHVYCLNCLDQLIQTSGQRGSILCPSCRTQVQTPRGGAQKLPKAFFQNTLGESVDKLKKLGLHQTSECSLCLQDGKHTSAVKLCTDCMSTLCHECLNTHNKIASSHKMFDCTKITPEDLNEILRNKTEKCKDHGEDIKLYCETCAELVCMMCAMLGHEGHTKQQVEKVVESHKKELEELQDSLTRRVQHYEHSLTKIDKAEKNCRAKAHRVTQAVDKHGEEIIERVQQVIKQVKIEVKSETEKSIKHLQFLHETLTQELSCLTNCVNHIEATLKHANTTTVINTSVKKKQTYQNILQHLLPNHNLPNMTFNLNLVDLSALKQLTRECLIGSVECKTHNEPLREPGATHKSVSAGQTGGLMTDPKKTPKVRVEIWDEGWLGIRECATDGSYITLEDNCELGGTLTGFRLVRNIDDQDQVTLTLPYIRLRPGQTVRLFARGQKPAGGSIRDIECNVPTWGTGDDIVTTLYDHFGIVAKHTQTTEYI